MYSFYSPPSINAPFQGYLKLVKATQEGETLKQGCDVTGIELGTSPTEGCTLTNGATSCYSTPCYSTKIRARLFERGLALTRG